MKRGIATLAMIAVLAPALAGAQQRPRPQPCSIRYNAGNPRLRELIRREGWAFRSYDKLCALLAREGMGIMLSSDNGVLAGRSYGWVLVRLYDIDSFVSGTEARSSTTLSMDASSPVADQVMLDSMNDALEGLASEPSRFVASVREEQARLRDVYRAPPRPAAK